VLWWPAAKPPTGTTAEELPATPSLQQPSEPPSSTHMALFTAAAPAVAPAAARAEWPPAPTALSGEHTSAFANTLLL